jgi:Domain of unknown function (DUF4159)/Aerotolerance regulator N-terminal
MGNLSFLTPLALWGLLALPIIWWLLRFTPPRPQTIQFPPLRILLSLKSKHITPDKTPWWLLLLRLALATAIIFSVAHPMLRQTVQSKFNNGPLLLVIDDGWAAATNWEERRNALITIIEDARSANRTIILTTTAPTLMPNSFGELAATDATNIVRAMQPQALNTDRLSLLSQLKTQSVKATSVTWLADGLDARSAVQFASGLQMLFGNTLTTLVLANAPTALAKPKIENSEIKITGLRGQALSTPQTVQAIAGSGRILAESTLNFSDSLSATTQIALPVELRNEIQSITIKGENHAGAKQLLDDRWRLKSVALLSGSAAGNVQQLLSPLHYAKSALTPFADVQEPENSTELITNLGQGLSVLLLADIGKLPTESHDAIANWIDKGGMLLRFAGPRMAAGVDDLMPVTLRQGDRNLGSALSWETPQAIQTFPDKSPFAGLKIESGITVSQQVLAEPEITLNEKTWASLSDGTPLVTAKKQGKGLIILFHITANADWSNLALSGTFVEMLQRIIDLAPAAGGGANKANDVASGDFSARLTMNGSGELVSPLASLPPISAKKIETATPTAQTPAGLYMRGSQERAINLDLKQSDLTPITGVDLRKIEPPKTISYAPYLFSLAALLFLVDCLAAIFLSGGFNRNAKAIVVLAILTMGLQQTTPSANADDQSDMEASLQTHLAFVKTGDADIDLTSQQGLNGLTLVMADRTSASLGDPVGLNLETDDLVFYPLIYWPVTEADESPSPAVIAKLEAYTKNGGTLFFDLRDNIGDFGGTSGTTEALRRILAKLDVPPLETVPDSHALTRSFYLLKKFPGRYETASLWVESQNAIGTTSTSDGVSGIIIGSNDYAAAWAMDAQGQPLNALIPGSDRQREMAFRVGVNVVMYVLTGNYKTDQIHIPALLKRLGE